jgi:hypothetical protein
MAQQCKRGLIMASGLLALALAIFGCAVGGGTSGGGGTTGGPTATPTPPPHALAWFQNDGAGVGQIWASLNGGAASQITHLTVPSGECVRDDNWVPPVFSPDLRHIVTSWSITSCGDIGPADDLYVVDVSSGAATLVPRDPGGLYLLRERSAGWIDNSTLWFMDQLNVEQAPIGGAPTTLATIGTQTGNHQVSLMDGVLRGHTLFYVTQTISTITSTANVEYAYALQRFDMSTHTTLGGSVNLGSAWDCQCLAHAPFSNSGVTPGFDASSDGAHIVYQRVTPNSSTTSSGVASSQFFYANADGSAASRIASYATAASFALMQLAPNGEMVAVTNALPAPSVFTASVTSPGLKGDPGLTFYTTNAGSYPAWNWDGRSFWASTNFRSGDLVQFTVGTPAGVVVAPGGHNPWSAIGH